MNSRGCKNCGRYTGKMTPNNNGYKVICEGCGSEWEVSLKKGLPAYRSQQSHIESESKITIEDYDKYKRAVGAPDARDK